MNLCFSSALLLAGLILGSSAQTNEECQVIASPLPTFELQLGRWNYIAGYINTAPFLELFKTVQSQWVNFVEGSSPGTFLQEIGIQHTTYCKYGTSQGVFYKNSGLIHKSNFTCTYHSLPTCDGCLLYHVDSTNNRNLVTIDNPVSTQDVPGYQAMYLMSRGMEVSPADLEHFKKQAQCVGFTGEPWVYDTKDTYCEFDKKEKHDN